MGIVEGLLHRKRLRECYLDIFIIATLKLLVGEEKFGKISACQHTNSQ